MRKLKPTESKQDVQGETVTERSRIEPTSAHFAIQHWVFKYGSPYEYGPWVASELHITKETVETDIRDFL